MNSVRKIVLALVKKHKYITMYCYYHIYTNKAKRNLFACLSGMAGHALYGMAPCFGHTGVTFDVENDRPGPGSLRGHFEVARGRFLRLKALF